MPNTIARVSDVPHRVGTITRAELHHAVVLVAVQGDRPVPRPGERGYARLAHVSLGGLIEAVWLNGQAAEMGIVATHAQVVRERERIKRENFADDAEFHQFLRKSRLTPRDVYERVELQILVPRIQARIVAGAGSKAEEQEAFQAFVDEFSEKWRARTVCAPEYAVGRCSNGPEPTA
ncbi:MAG TPA: hypothetical protein VFY04_09955 [Solirubrobacterales bacterium]|nr:hypothetical protein [Solirubrobacterales bacterium]